MRDDKSALLSMLDAAVFTLIVGMLVIGMFSLPGDGSQEMRHAAGVHDNFLRLKLSPGGLPPELSSYALGPAELVSLYMLGQAGDEVIKALEDCMSALLGPGRDWMLHFEWNGEALTLGTIGLDLREESRMTLRSSTLPNGESISSRLWV